MTTSEDVTYWRCTACGSRQGRQRFPVPADGTESGVEASAFRPSSDRFGQVLAGVFRCDRCGHGSLDVEPQADVVRRAYEDAADPVSLREERGQLETARRALEQLEAFVAPGVICDVGCWTGSFLVAAQERGWRAVGVEPSRWASERARDRGLEVHTATLEDHGLPPGRADAVVLCDVLEHMLDPDAALQVVSSLLAPGGAVYVTVPDAGSVLARAMGRRWWSVLPMHVQYFTRRSLRELLEANGFRVRSMRTHPKVFSVRYYLERLAGYSSALSRAMVAIANRTGHAEQLVGPDFHDRVAVIATKR